MRFSLCGTAHFWCDGDFCPVIHLPFPYILPSFGCSQLREGAVTFTRDKYSQEDRREEVEFPCRVEAYRKSPNLLFKLFKVFLGNLIKNRAGQRGYILLSLSYSFLKNLAKLNKL